MYKYLHLLKKKYKYEITDLCILRFNLGCKIMIEKKINF